MYRLEYDKGCNPRLGSILERKSLKDACLNYKFKVKHFKSFEAMDLFIKNDKECNVVVRITKLHGYNN